MPNATAIEPVILFGNYSYSIDDIEYASVAAFQHVAPRDRDGQLPQDWRDLPEPGKQAMRHFVRTILVLASRNVIT